MIEEIQSYDEDEKVLRKAYDLRGCEQNTSFWWRWKGSKGSWDPWWKTKYFILMKMRR